MKTVPPQDLVKGLSLSFAGTVVAFTAFVILAAADVKLYLSPATLSILGYLFVIVWLISTLCFCVSSAMLARRLGLNLTIWVVLPFVTSPFGLWVAYFMLLKTLREGRAGEQAITDAGEK